MWISYQPSLFYERAQAQRLNATYILNTHGHSDHTNGNDEAKTLTGAQVALYKSSTVQHDINLEDSQILTLGSFEIVVLHTPGHIEDHVVYFLPLYKIAITGDHLFVGKIGGTDTEDNARLQYESFQKLYAKLPPETSIWPGHDLGCRPSSTLELERATNPFLKAKDFQEFLHVKKVWPQFKKTHGLI